MTELDSIRERWSVFIDSCRGKGAAGTLDALLKKACEPIGLEGNTLILGFSYDFHRSKIEEPQYRILVQEQLKSTYGKTYNIRCVLLPHVNSPEQRIIKLSTELTESGNELRQALLAAILDKFQSDKQQLDNLLDEVKKLQVERIERETLIAGLRQEKMSLIAQWEHEVQEYKSKALKQIVDNLEMGNPK